MPAGDSDSQFDCGMTHGGGGNRTRLARYGLLIFLPICALLVFIIGNDRGKLSKEAERTANKRREQIRAELVELAGKHDWAGEYYQGDGKGVNVSLILSPKHGHVFEWHGCLGVYDRNYGEVTAVEGKLRLSFTFQNERKGFQGIASEFVPVPWGSRKYLIPSDDIVGFCNEVNARAEPRDELHGWYLLRCGDEKTRVTGWPRVPPQYEMYLLAHPVEARIVAVNKSTTRPSVCEWNFRDTNVTLDAGKADRLLVGMELYVMKPEGMVESVRIIKVENHAAEAVMTQDEQRAKPLVGWELSTLPAWRRDPTSPKTSSSASQPATGTRPQGEENRGSPRR